MNAVLMSAWVAWGGWCVWQARGAAHAWVEVRDAVRGLGLGTFVNRGLGPALVRHARTLGAAGVLWAGLIGLGATLVEPVNHHAPWKRLAWSLLAGFAVLGGWNLGLAYTGLFFPGLLIGCAVAPMFLPAGFRVARAAWRAGVPPPPTRWVLAGFVPFAVAAVLMLLPDTNGDALWVHLALPAQTLWAHKLTAEGTSVVLQYPLLAEMVYSVAVAAGHDALAHFLQAAPFVASVILLAGWCATEAGPVAGWLAAAAVTSLGLTGSLAIVAKNDLVAAGFVVAGVLAAAERNDGLAAVWLGCAAATKYNGAVLLVVGWMALSALRRRPMRRSWILLAAGPVLPWLMKNWLMMGDPVWPALSRWLPGALWDPASTANLRLLAGPWNPGVRLAGLPMEAARALVANHPGVAVLLPVGLAGLWRSGRTVRWMAGFAAAGIAALWWVLPIPAMRYAAAPFMLLTGCLVVMTVHEARTWPPRARRWVLAAVLAAGWLPLGSLLATGIEPGYALPFLAGRITEADYRAGRLTTYWDAVVRLGALPGHSRILPVGVIFTYHLPVRVMAERTFSRTWGWALAREARSTEELFKRIRQTGCRYVLYNLVGEASPNPDAQAYPWDDRSLALWRDDAGRGLRPVSGSDRLDARLGGFCLYEIRSHLMVNAPARLAYLPGIRSLLYGVTRHGGERDGLGWLNDALALQRRLPGVDEVDLLVAGGFRRTHDWARAYAAYRGPCSRGVLSLDALPGLAESAAFLGKEPEALRWWDRATALNPDAARADAGVRQALREIAEGRRTSPVIY